MGLADLKSSIMGQVNSIVKDFNKIMGNEGSYYKESPENGIKKPIKTNWNKILPYGFKIVSSEEKPEIPENQLNNFDLNLNPQSINLDDVYSISITPTFGGIVSEHNFIVLRDLVITGVTGVHPGRGESGVLEGMSEESGYEQIHHLMNFIRSYALRKKQGEQVQLIYVNRKDNEEYVVEPIKITRKKSVPKSTLYEYSLSFKVISVYFKAVSLSSLDQFLNDFDNVLQTVYSKIQAARSILLKSTALLKNVQSEVIDQILEPLRQITSFCQALGGFSQTLVDLPMSFWEDLKYNTTTEWDKMVNALKGVVPNFDKYATKNSSYTGNNTTQLSYDTLTIMQSLAVLDYSDPKYNIDNFLNKKHKEEVLKDQQKILNTTTKQNISNLRGKIEDLRSQIIDYANLGSTQYDEWAERTNTATGISDTKVSTDEEIIILDSLQQAANNLMTLEVLSPTIFNETLTEKSTQVNSVFENNVSINTASSVKSIILDMDTTLEDIAAKYLGTASRWVDIAVLNNLKPPYISNTQMKNTISPGGIVLIPQDNPVDIVYQMPLNKTPINADLNQTELNMGIDIKLNFDNNDLEVKNNDFKLIAGVDNLIQATKMKLSVDKGELKYHTNYGLGIEVGEKITSYTATSLYDEINAAILSDDRVESIKNMDIAYENNSLIINLMIKAKETNEPVPIFMKF